MSNASMLRLFGAMVAVVTLGASTMGAASAGAATRITMERDGRDLVFDVPASVEKGSKLKIENRTNPNQVGPHTFSLAKKSAIPRSNRELQRCFEGLPVCTAVSAAHEFDPTTGEVAKRTVDSGKKGWDAAFSQRRKGDSWYTDKKNETETRKVKAQAGKTLRFFCLVHPDMQGKIKVKG